MGARWLLGLAGAVVVLWVGAAFLAAAPAAAAVVVPMAAAQGLQKGGTTRLMSAGDGGGSDGDSGGSDKKEKKEKKKDKKEGKKKDKSEKKEDKKADDKNDEKEKSEKKQDGKKKEKKSEARESQDDQDEDQARHAKRAKHEQADDDEDADHREKDDRDDADRREKSDREKDDRDDADRREKADRDKDDRDKDDREKSDRDDADRDDAGARQAAHEDDGSDVADRVRKVVREKLQDSGTEHRGDSEKSAEAARDDDPDADDIDEAGKSDKAGETSKGEKTGKGDGRDEADGERADRRSEVTRLVTAKLSERASDHEDSDASDEAGDDRSGKRASARVLEGDEDHGGKKTHEKKKRDEQGRAPPRSDDDVRHLLREVGAQLDGDDGDGSTEGDGAKKKQSQKKAEKKAEKQRAEDEARESRGSEVVAALRRLGDSDGKDGKDGDSEGGKDSVRDVVKRVAAQLADRDEKGERSQRARDDRKKVREKNGKKGASERRDGEKLADSVRGLVREAVEHAADRAGVSKDDVARVIDSARKRLRDADGEERGEKAGKSGEASEKAALAELLDAAGADGDRKADEKVCRGGKGCSASELRKREASLLSSRGPPKGERARKSDVDQLQLLSARDEDDSDKGDDSDRDDDSDDDSAEQSERVLQGRIDVDKSKAHLAGEKKKVAAGKVTAAQYKKDKAEHDKLASKYEADRAELSDERAELIDDVVDGQRGLDEAEKKLAAEEKNVAAGKVTKKAHDRNVAKFEKQRDKVYDDTEDLMDATDRDARVVPDDGPDGAGAVAGCGSDGAFVECGSSSESGDAKKDSDRDLCVSGVSSGCGASSRSGDSRAEASCDDSGCGSSASSRGADGKISKASARCSGDARNCGQHSLAIPGGASAYCDSGGGSCRSDSTGPDPDVATPPDPGDSDRRTAASAACTGDCAVDTVADRSGAESDCDTAGGSCDSSSTDAGHETGAEKAAATAAARSATNGKAVCTVSGAGGCSTRSTSNAEGDSGDDGDSRGTAGSSDAVVEVDCGAGCVGKGSTSTVGTASGVRAGAERTSTGSSSCEATGSGCQAYSNTAVDNPVDGQDSLASLTDGDATVVSSAGANVDCGDGPCSGAARSATSGTAVGAPAGKGAAAPVRTTKASSNCNATGGGCAAESSSQLSDSAADDATEPSWSDRLSAAARGTTLAVRELAASSTAGSELSCLTATCTGAGSSTTSGGASGDVKGVRDSTGSSSCTAHGVGGGCTTSADTTVADRDPADATDVATAAGVAPVSGPVSVSNAAASVACSGAATECGGTARSSTSARDTAVTPHARGTSASADCTVTGGGCSGETSSAASSAADYVAVDPDTGEPLPGQSLSGPSSTSSSNAGLACTPGVPCSGSVRTSTAAWDGGVAGGKPRTSEGTAGCTGGTGGCQVRSASGASTGPGAELAFSGPQAQGTAQQVNTARMPAGPSAASVAGAALTCEGQAVCTGKVTSSATATDPSVSPDPRGSRSEGSCEGVSGGVCQAVTNSGAATGPNANSMVPLVQARSTENATVSSETTGDAPAQDQETPAGGQDQPAVPPAPTAPGSSASTGGPTVPGASSWTMASATLDCPGGSGPCSGTARSSATGSDGPKAMNGAGTARGPPATGTSTSSGSCTSTQSGCQVQTESSAGSGQVVADIVAEQRNNDAEQAKQQAAEAAQLAAQAADVAARPGATAAQRKAATAAAAAAKKAGTAATEAAKLAAKPVTDAPATLAQSSATAQCAGPGCTAATTGGTSGTPGRSDTAAHCTAAASGCVAVSQATAVTERSRDSGEPGGKPVPVSSGSGQADSEILCPEIGCTGTVSGNGEAVAGPAGQRSHSTATGSTRCDGTTTCHANITATVSSMATAPGAEESDRLAATSAAVQAVCDNGTEAGCATRGSSRSTAVGGDEVHASSSSACQSTGICQTGTGGFAAEDSAGSTADCIGTGCRTRTEGTAQSAAPGGTNKAASRTACTAGHLGGCEGTSRVGANQYGSQASATCQGSTGSRCSYGFSSRSSAADSGGGASSRASASGSESGTFGGGWVATSASAVADAGTAQASAFCAGTVANCRYSYSGTASSSAAYDDGTHSSSANAYASGSGGGTGQGGGGLLVFAHASAGKGYGNAEAGCSGVSNCSTSYSSRADASKTVGGQHGEAWSKCSGGGTGGSCGSYASVKVDSHSALAQAGCSGTGSCDSYFATTSASSAKGEGIKGDSGGNCSGGGPDGGYCATGSKATYSKKTGELELSSYCGTQGGTCSRWADLDIDASSPDGELHGKGEVDCKGGVGSCGVIGVAKYYKESKDKDGNPIPPTLVVGTGCDTQGGGSCSQWSKAYADISALDGKLTADAAAECSGTTGWCSTVVAGGYTEKKKGENGEALKGGEIVAYADCQGGGGSACTKSEAHINGELVEKGKATPGGPTEGTMKGEGYTHCDKTSGTCSVGAVFLYHDAAESWKRDKDGNLVLDENGNKIPVYETEWKRDKDGKFVLDENGKKIPVESTDENGEKIRAYDPAYIEVQTSCYPKGDHCKQDAKFTGTIDQHNEHEKHTGTADTHCSGTWGACSVAGSVAYNPETGKVTAFTDCGTGDEGGTACDKSETHTYAWAESPDGKLHGTGHSDCTEDGGRCSSVSMAKYHAEYIRPIPDSCYEPPGCFTATVEDRTTPEYLTAGAGCDTDGNAEKNCSYDFSADGQREASGDEGRLSAQAQAGCNESHTGNGSGGCSIAATAKVNAKDHTADVLAMCEGSTSCTYSGSATANYESGKNNADSTKTCGKDTSGTCFIGVSAFAAGGDDEKQGLAVASGFCSDTNGTCKGEFRTHVDSNRDTLADCHSKGSGICYGIAVPQYAESGGRVFDDHTSLFVDTKAPGGEEHKECSNGKNGHKNSCGEGWSEALDGKAFVLHQETEKSVGGFLKNLVRDGDDVLSNAIPGLLTSIGTELFNYGKLRLLGKDEGLLGLVTGGNVGFSSPEQGENESDLEYYARRYPFTGGVATGAVNFYDRWIKNGPDPGRLGDDYYFAPISTALEDIGTVALVAFGAGAVIKAISLGAKTGGALASGAGSLAGRFAVTSRLGEGLAGGASRLRGWAPRASAVGQTFWDASLMGGKVAMAPVTLELMGARALTGVIARRGLAPLGERLATRGGMLGQVGGVLKTGASAGSIIGRGGVFGRVGVKLLRDKESGRLGFERTDVRGLITIARGYQKLGLPFGRVAALGDVVAAGRDASVPPRTGLSRVLGQKRADSIRQNRINRAVAAVLDDQLARIKGTNGGPARLSGKDLTPAERMVLEDAVARGVVVEQLTPEQLSELSGVPLSEITAAGCRGVCAIDGLNRTVAANIDDLVLFSHNGKIFIDGQILAALRDGRLSRAALADLVRHELDELNRNGRAHGDLHELPDLSPLADDVAAANRATRQQVDELFDRAGWPEATRDGKLAENKIEQLRDPAIFAEVEATLRAQEAGRIVGMKDWLEYNAGKAPAQLAEAAAELGVARQLARENPGMVVRVGLENNAPMRPGTNQPMKEFDLTVETPDGQVVASVEVTSVDKPVSQPSDVTNGVRHAVDKAADRQGTPTPIAGNRQVIIHMSLDVGRRSMRGGLIREIQPDGTLTLFRPDGKTPIKDNRSTGNLYDDIAQNLPAIKNHKLLDRVTLIDDVTGRETVYVRDGETWTRQGEQGVAPGEAPGPRSPGPGSEPGATSGGNPTGPDTPGPGPGKLPPVNPPGERAGGGGARTSGGGADPHIAESSSTSGPRSHLDDSAPAAPREGHQRPRDPDADNGGPAPPQQGVETSAPTGELAGRTDQGPARQGTPEAGQRPGPGATGRKDSTRSTTPEEARPGTAHDANTTNHAPGEQGVDAKGVTTPAETNPAGGARTTSGPKGSRGATAPERSGESHGSTQSKTAEHQGTRETFEEQGHQPGSTRPGPPNVGEWLAVRDVFDSFKEWRATRKQNKADRTKVAKYREGFDGKSYDDLIARAEEVAQDVENGKRSYADGIVECVAIACEVQRRVNPDKAPFEEQVLGAIALVRDGRVVQMLTGEGKTLTGAIAIVARALIERPKGGQVQWVTPSEAYAGEAKPQITQIAERLGLTVELQTAARESPGRTAADEAAIKVLALGEEAFGALRSRNGTGNGGRAAPAWRLLDEVDQLLLDDIAPFVLSERIKGGKPDLAALNWAKEIAEAKRLSPATEQNPNGHYNPRTYELTAAGRKLVGEQIDALAAATGRKFGAQARATLQQRVENALKAEDGLEINVDYMVENGEIVLIASDNRALPGRRWSRGLHEAVELKEFGDTGVGAPTRTIDSLTVAELLAEGEWAGTTGTTGGKAGAKRFQDEYGKDVLEIDPHTPLKRVDFDPANHGTAAEAREAALNDVLDAYAQGFPVLLRVESIADALIMERLLWEHGINPRMVTAKSIHQSQAAGLTTHAGRRGAVTVATDIAGRARDIELGGSIAGHVGDYMLRNHPGLEPWMDGYRTARNEAVEWAEAHVKAELKDLDVEGGGLHVIGLGTPRSVRIQEQLRGRSGRIGPDGERQHGTTRIHRSMEDRLVRENSRYEFVVDEGPTAITGKFDGPEAEAVFELAQHDAEVAASARLAATKSQKAALGSDHLGMVLGDELPAGVPALPANPGNIDVHHLDALRNTEMVPGLTAEQYLQARADARRFQVEQDPATQELADAAEEQAFAEAVARLADLIPTRNWVVRARPMTPADVAKIREHAQQAADAFAHGTELAAGLGMDGSQLAAMIVVARHMLGVGVGKDSADPAQPLRLDRLNLAELFVLVHYANGQSTERIAAELGIYPRHIEPLLAVAANGALTGSVISKLAGPGRDVRTEQAARKQATVKKARPVRRETGRGTELATTQDWSLRDLADALALATGRPLPEGPITAEVLDELRAAAGLDRLAILRGAAPAAPHPTPHYPGVLVAHVGIGPVDAPEVNRESRLFALLALDEHVHGLHGTPPARTTPSQGRTEGRGRALLGLGASILTTALTGGVLGLLGQPVSVLYLAGGALVAATATRVLLKWGAGTIRGPPRQILRRDRSPGGPSRRGGGDLTGKMSAKLASWVAKQHRRGSTVVVTVAVRDAHGTVVGVLRLLPLRGMSAWAQRLLGVDDLVAFAWVGSGERLVAVDAELFAQIQHVQQVIATARAKHTYGGRAGELQRMLDGWVFDVFRHENVHFDHPGARHDDAVFDGHRHVRHGRLDRAVAFAEYLDRKMRFYGATRNWGRSRIAGARALLDRLAEISAALGSATPQERAWLLGEARAKRARLDEVLGTTGAGPAAPVRGRAGGRQEAMQAAAEGWAQLPDAELGEGEAAAWEVWRLLGALLRAGAPRLSHPRGAAAADLVAQIGELGHRLADGQPIDAPEWVAPLIQQMVRRGLHEPGAAKKIEAWLAEFERLGLLTREVDLFGVERFRPGGVFGLMLARAPPQAVDALWRNPLGVAGVGVAGLSSGEQAAAVRTWLRGVVLAWGAVERGWRLAVPLRLRGWWLAAEVRQAERASRDAIADVVEASEELAGAEAAGVTGDELTTLIGTRDEANRKLAQVVGAARDVAAANGLSAHRVRNVGVPPLFVTEGRLYMPILPAMFVAGVTWALGLGPAWGALWLPLWGMFPHMKTARTPGSKPGIRGYVKSIRWERAWMLAALSFTFLQTTLWSWVVAGGLVTVELVGLGGVVAGFLSTSMSRGLREEPDQVAWLTTESSPVRMKWPFTAIPDTRLWLRISINLFGLGWLRVGPAFYTFWQTPADFMPVPGVREPKVKGWTRLWQRLRNWAASYDKGLSSRRPAFYTFHFLGLLVGFNDQLILDQRVLFKQLSRERQARRRALDIWTGASRTFGKLIFLAARGLEHTVPVRLGRRLARLSDWWVERAFLHLANHAQRMLVRNLTEQAWQRKQLAKPHSEKAKKQWQAALVENERRAAEIRTTMDRLAGEYEQRLKALHEAKRDLLRARLKGVDDRLAARTWGRKLLDVRKARLEAQLELVEHALADLVAPPLRQGRYLRRAMERQQAKLERLRGKLRKAHAQLADARAGGDRDRVRALKARVDELQARFDAAGWRDRMLERAPGASGVPAGTTLRELWAEPWVRWTVRVLVLAAALVGVVVLLSMPAGATPLAGAGGASNGAATSAGWWADLGRFLDGAAFGALAAIALVGVKAVQLVRAHGPPAWLVRAARRATGGRTAGHLARAAGAFGHEVASRWAQRWIGLRGIADPQLRHQLRRVIGSGVPAQVVADLRALAERGELTAEELRRLLAVGRWKGVAGPAQAIGAFAAAHGLEWGRSTKKRLREALRELPDETRPRGRVAAVGTGIRNRLVRAEWVQAAARALVVVVLATLFLGLLPNHASNGAYALRGGLNSVSVRAGLMSQLKALALLGTFVVNVVAMVSATVTGAGLSAWISGLYAATVVMFFLGALKTESNVAHGRGESASGITAWLLTWVAMPITSNVGNVLLAISVGWVAAPFDPVLLAATVVLTVAFANMSVLGVVEALRPTTFGGKYHAVMGRVGNISLLYWGLVALWPQQWPLLVVAGAVVGVVVAGPRGVSKLMAWRARLTHSPPAERAAIRSAVLGRFWWGVVPGLLMAGLGFFVPLGVLELSAPVTVAAVSAAVTLGALWILNWIVPHKATGKAPDATVVNRWISLAPAAGESSRLRPIGAFLRGTAVGTAAAVLAALLGAPTVVLVIAAAVAAVSPVLAAAAGHHWARGPPWTRILTRAVAIVAAVVALLALGGDSASATPPQDSVSAPGVGTAHLLVPPGSCGPSRNPGWITACSRPGSRGTSRPCRSTRCSTG
ncbi:preprotein translocase subunit SecA [Pseudonocardia sp. DLS-67]